MSRRKAFLDDPTEVFYMCDPAKATTCAKTACYINGGDCELTTKPSWGVKKVDCDYIGGKKK